MMAPTILRTSAMSVSVLQHLCFPSLYIFFPSENKVNGMVNNHAPEIKTYLSIFAPKNIKILH